MLGVSEEIERSAQVRVLYRDLRGGQHAQDADGLYATSPDQYRAQSKSNAFVKSRDRQRLKEAYNNSVTVCANNTAGNTSQDYSFTDLVRR